MKQYPTSFQEAEELSLVFSQGSKPADAFSSASGHCFRVEAGCCAEVASGQP